MRPTPLSRLWLASLASLCAFACGCANLDVTVHVLDQKYWSSTAYAQSLYREDIVRMAGVIHRGEFARRREQAAADATAAFDEFVHRNARSVPKLAARRQTVRDSLRSEVNNRYEAARTRFLQAFAVLSRADSEKPAELQAAIREYGEGAAELQVLEARINAFLDVSEAAPAAKDAMTAEANSVSQAATKPAQGLIGDYGILDDPLASAIVYAPEEYWVGCFNETSALGALGNTDIAIRMENVGNFTIKGVRNDAAKITQATFAVGRAAVQTVAAVYGVPISRAGAGAASQPTSKPGEFLVAAPDFENPNRRANAALQAAQHLRMTKLAIFELLVASKDRLVAADDAVRSATIRAIRPLLVNYAGVLNPPRQNP